MKRREQRALYTLLTTRSWSRRITALLVLVSAGVLFYTQQHGLSWSQNPHVIHGRVVGVADGDTVTLLTQNHTSLRIRLAFIDAPEKQQPYGQAAKKNLSDLLYNQFVDVHIKATDPYGRTVGQIFKDDKDINLVQVASGYAWHYTVYAKKMQSQAAFATYARAQTQAKQKRIGLWQEADPMPPWKFRRSAKKQALLKAP